MYPKLLAKIGAVPGGPKMKRIPVQTAGAPKCMIPYGSQAKTERKVEVWAERMLLRLAP